MSRRAKTLGTLIETAFEGPECAEKGRSDHDGEGFLLKDREEQEYLLAIQPATHGMFERLIVRQRSMGLGSSLMGMHRVPGSRGHKPLPLCWGTCNVSGTRPSLPWRGELKKAASSAK